MSTIGSATGNAIATCVINNLDTYTVGGHTFHFIMGIHAIEVVRDNHGTTRTITIDHEIGILVHENIVRWSETYFGCLLYEGVLYIHEGFGREAVSIDHVCWMYNYIR